jgi:hypothetical protein
MRKLGVLLIALGLLLFLGPVVGARVEVLRWTSQVDNWGPMVGLMIKTVVLVMGVVLSLSSKPD